MSVPLETGSFQEWGANQVPAGGTAIAPWFAGLTSKKGEVPMADQRSRGGKKRGPAAAPGQPEQHQTTGAPNQQRPAEGQPGGPKPREGDTRTEKHK
jgi:hypothetical protein